MKLISFAAISLLAITVSAYPRQSPDAQEMDQSQDAAQDMQIPQDASQDMHQSDQHMAQGGLENLEKAYEELENRTFEIYNSIWMLEQTKLELRSEMQRLGACADIKAELEELEKVKEEQDGVKAELDALEEIH
ncbi:hypothetical protein BASA62_007531 [Batrachochytrium salamandrivorans]|nr:hypothetical protein BASA62_007531 [Batrachochytrium salamandrivorans]